MPTLYHGESLDASAHHVAIAVWRVLDAARLLFDLDDAAVAELLSVLVAEAFGRALATHAPVCVGDLCLLHEWASETQRRTLAVVRALGGGNDAPWRKPNVSPTTA